MDGEVERGSGSADGAGAETARQATSVPTARVVRSIAVQLVDVWGAARGAGVCGATRDRWPLGGCGGLGCLHKRNVKAYLLGSHDKTSVHPRGMSPSGI